MRSRRLECCALIGRKRLVEGAQRIADCAEKACLRGEMLLTEGDGVRHRGAGCGTLWKLVAEGAQGLNRRPRGDLNLLPCIFLGALKSQLALQIAAERRMPIDIVIACCARVQERCPGERRRTRRADTIRPRGRKTCQIRSTRVAGAGEVLPPERTQRTGDRRLPINSMLPPLTAGTRRWYLRPDFALSVLEKIGRRLRSLRRPAPPQGTPQREDL